MIAYVQLCGGKNIQTNAEKLVFDHLSFENYSSAANVDDIKLNYLELVAYGGGGGTSFRCLVTFAAQGNWKIIINLVPQNFSFQ